MISDLLLIDKNSISSVHNTHIDIFGVSLDTVADIVYDTESNQDDFSDASYTNLF